MKERYYRGPQELATDFSSQPSNIRVHTNNAQSTFSSEYQEFVSRGMYIESVHPQYSASIRQNIQDVSTGLNTLSTSMIQSQERAFVILSGAAPTVENIIPYLVICEIPIFMIISYLYQFYKLAIIY